MQISTIIKVTKLGTSLVVSILHDIFRVAWKLIPHMEEITTHTKRIFERLYI